MVYKIKVTDRAEKQIENAIQYLAVNLKSMQAANNLMEDINQAFALLEAFTASFSFCEDSYLAYNISCRGKYRIFGRFFSYVRKLQRKIIEYFRYRRHYG